MNRWSENDEDDEDSSSSSFLPLSMLFCLEHRRTLPDRERVSLAPPQRTLSEIMAAKPPYVKRLVRGC